MAKAHRSPAQHFKENVLNSLTQLCLQIKHVSSSEFFWMRLRTSRHVTWLTFQQSTCQVKTGAGYQNEHDHVISPHKGGASTQHQFPPRRWEDSKAATTHLIPKSLIPPTCFTINIALGASSSCWWWEKVLLPPLLRREDLSSTQSSAPACFPHFPQGGYISFYVCESITYNGFSMFCVL